MSSDQLINALLVNEKGGQFTPGQTKKPVPSDEQLLVKVSNISVNPVDWVMAAYGIFITEYPAVLGCDGAGVVESVGKNVTRFKSGDKIFAYTGLGKPGRGTFAEYFVVSEKQAWAIPENLTPQEAVTFPVCLLTAALAVHQNFKIEFLPKTYPGESFLVWGASSGVGLFAVQLAKLSGFHVVATASDKNFELVRKFGADEVFDYRDTNAAEKIKAATAGKLQYAFDCVSPQSSAICASVLRTEGEAFLASTTGFTSDPVPANVKAERVDLGLAPDQPEGVKLLERLNHYFEPLIRSGQLKPLPIWQFPDGWQGIIDGLQASKDKKVSGQKIVVNL
eukprot:TRINITY_DN461_c0_g1_i1.p1 TRINITY_DN461_c0_g1~~TRINITY_DN461_c0_g1_i1.p1  ORF type:complete len:336 (+),score=85.97 TRINITY_DN461_c0_g1_i1:90-1097(+)